MVNISRFRGLYIGGKIKSAFRREVSHIESAKNHFERGDKQILFTATELYSYNTGGMSYEFIL